MCSSDLTNMYREIRQRFWWAKMKLDIAQFIAECDVCRRAKAEYQKPFGIIPPTPVPVWKWDEVEMNFFTGFPKTEQGYTAVWVLVDHLSKVAHFIPIHEHSRAKQLADLFVSMIVPSHGVPRKIMLDYGNMFTSKTWNSFKQSMGSHIPSAIIYQPSADCHI